MKRTIPMTLALVSLCAGAVGQAASPATTATTATTATKAAPVPVSAIKRPTEVAQPVKAASATDRVALNPQPLPPNPPDPDRTKTQALKQGEHAADKKTAAEKKGIIIIGGKKAVPVKPEAHAQSNH